jgi:hypothetical protein
MGAETRNVCGMIDELTAEEMPGEIFRQEGRALSNPITQDGSEAIRNVRTLLCVTEGQK